MAAKTIVIVEQDRIEAYEAVARPFFRDVLDMNYDECLVTDESRLSDFSSCGLPDELSEGSASLQELYARWDQWVLAELTRRYGVTLQSTAVLLVDLLDTLEKAGRTRLQ